MNLKPGSKRCAQNQGTSGKRDQEAGERKEVRDPADGVFVLLGNEQEHKRAYQRREEDDREDVVMHSQRLAFSC